MLFRFATTQFQDNTCEENTLRFTEGCVCVWERDKEGECDVYLSRKDMGDLN